MPERDESFFRLSPDRVLSAVERAGFVLSGHCTALNALENRVYDLRLEDGHHVIAKFYRPARWSRDAILDEHRMLFALRDAEIPVCVPLRGSDGETLRETHEIHYAVWPRTGGRSPDELSDDELAVLGRLLARIHNVGAVLQTPHRQTLDERLPLAALALLEDRGFLPPACARAYREATLEIVRIYERLASGVALHPIHGDCHAGNLLRGDDGWFFLDFDDMLIGPAVQDVWMLVPGRDAAARRQRDVLVRAYRDFRDFDEGSLRLVEPLRAFRFVWYAGWIARRWDDPAFPDAFPHFGTEQFWENETRDLVAQVDRLLRGDEIAEDEAEGPKPAAEEPELTNSDVFWDL
jgi:Ser/Thr protein kinase RdoA (MazF antagonist)